MQEIVNALSIDVEDYFQVSAFAEQIDPLSWDKQASRVEANTRKCLELFAEYKVRATFFVLGWIAQRYPHLVREIAAAGHEIASHGYSHQLVYRQTPQQFRQETLDTKNILEDITQTPVQGYRAASYSITRASLWALDILAEAGFIYDSSIFPVRHDRYGLPDAPRFPYCLTTPGGNRLVEFPISTKKIGTYRLPVGGGGYFRLFPYMLSRYALASINRREQQPFVFYLHPWELDPQQPRIAGSLLSRFRHYNNLDKCEARLRNLLQNFRFAGLREVLQTQGLLKAVTPTVCN